MYAGIRIYKSAFIMLIAAFAVLCIGVAREFRVSGDDGVEVPIIMYHSVVSDDSLAGEYVATVGELESDLRYLQKEGYTPVFCAEVADYVDGKGNLPDKPIIISFDDGCYNNFYYVLPLLEKYDVKAVFSVVGKWCGEAAEEAEPSPAYSYMDIENVTSLALSGRCEIANHSWDMHSYDERSGVCRLDGESDRDYTRAFCNDASQARRLLEKSGAQIDVYAYPYGYYCADSDRLLKELGYRVTLGCEEKVNFVSSGDYGCLTRMGRFNRSGYETTEDFFAKIE